MDPYVDPDSGLLRNRLGITDAGQLAVAEGQLAYHAEIRLYARRTFFSRYDLDALQAVHRHLFEDIYDWAGQLRTIDFSKGTTLFARHRFLRTQAEDTFRWLSDRDELRGLERDDFAGAASHLLAELNALHPFREGNGRAQRAFLQLLARRAGYQLAWAKVDPWENLQASQAAMVDDDAFRPLLQRILRPAEPAIDFPLLRMLREHDNPGLDL